MHIGEIITTDSANGRGIRVTIFVSGCLNRCEGCFQPETWDFDYGREYTPEIEDFIISELSKPYYDGLTLLGGDPMEEPNQRALLPLVKRVKKELPDRNIWAFTGYIYEEDLIPGGKRYFDITDDLLDHIDTLVDGPFMIAKKNILLNFRGSDNQRILNLKATRETGTIVFDPLNN